MGTMWVESVESMEIVGKQWGEREWGENGERGDSRERAGMELEKSVDRVGRVWIEYIELGKSEERVGREWRDSGDIVGRE